MLKTEILKTDDEEWDRRIENLELQDIFYSRGYYEINSTFSGAEAEMFVYGDRDNYVVYPYLKKKINSLPFLAFGNNDLKETFFDISNLEYGGPAIAGDKTILVKFLKEFKRYCLENHIVTEWCRLHPFLENHQGIPNAIEIQKVYYVDLGKSEEQIFSEFEGICRTAVKKGKKEDVRIIKTDRKSDLDQFYTIYHKTMESYKAKAFYYYSRQFFDDIFDELKDSISLFIAKKDEKTIAASLFLSGRDVAHYYLSARDPVYSSLCPNNLMLYEVMLYYRKQGCKIFNLGGKYGKQESLARFKAQFTKTKKSFYRVQMVHDEEVYHKLCMAYRVYLKQKGIVDNDENYFPLYRGLE